MPLKLPRSEAVCACKVNGNDNGYRRGLIRRNRKGLPSRNRPLTVPNRVKSELGSCAEVIVNMLLSLPCDIYLTVREIIQPTTRLTSAR